MSNELSDLKTQFQQGMKSIVHDTVSEMGAKLNQVAETQQKAIALLADVADMVAKIRARQNYLEEQVRIQQSLMDEILEYPPSGRAEEVEKLKKEITRLRSMYRGEKTSAAK